ncbi:MAG: thiamine phosphate synthase [Candidatus Omnitrophica bacterium]|nr:thiamine phosphate synthase [Candidatus Omnitrophota bacterium]
MPSNKKRLVDRKLYLILDTQVLVYDRLLSVLKTAVRCGADIVQLRDKNGSAQDILSFCRQALKITAGRIPFIVNDRVDLVCLSGANGVHLGQEDIPCSQARRMMGPKAMIGVSCQTYEHARKAQNEGADYIGFGSVFKTQTKPDRHPMDLGVLGRVVGQARIPVFPIGGINRSNVGVLTAMGIQRAAVCRDILLAKDVGGSVEEFQKILRG